MNLQKTVLLSTVYQGQTGERDFSTDLADNLDALNIGNFEEVETEANVDTLKADIVAIGDDGILVVENQFGKADWDHWGRLEAYARFKEATVAALVAENFTDLMITTCSLRNNESEINWYLIQVEANSHREIAFRHIAWPIIDPGVEYSEFWQPICQGVYGEVFSGSPVPLNRERSKGKQVKRIRLTLNLLNDRCYIQLIFKGSDRGKRRDNVMELFPVSEYEDRDTRDTALRASVIFPVLDKGKNDRDDWDEIREKLVNMGTDIYNKINESGL